MRARERNALQAFLVRVAPAAKSKIHAMILYGSVARGEAGPESDIDLCIIWDGPEWEAREALLRPGAQAFLETGVLVSPHALSADRHAQLLRDPTLFWRNVEHDGIAFAA